MNPRDRRALMIGAIVAAVAFVAMRVAPWALGAFSEAKADAESKAARIARIRELIREAPELEDSAVLIRTRLAALAPRLLVGRRETEAQSDLSARFAAAASNPRVRIQRTEPISDTVKAGALRRTSLSAAVEADNTGIVDLLGSLAGDSAALVVDEIQLTASNPHSSRAEPERLNAELVVRGWYLGEGEQ